MNPPSTKVRTQQLCSTKGPVPHTAQTRIPRRQHTKPQQATVQPKQHRRYAYALALCSSLASSCPISLALSDNRKAQRGISTRRFTSGSDSIMHGPGARVAYFSSVHTSFSPALRRACISISKSVVTSGGCPMARASCLRLRHL